MRKFLSLSCLLGLWACDHPSIEIPNEPDPMQMDDGVPESVKQAKALYPRLIDVYAGPIQKSCSPNPGVCHNANNYPDLRTPGALIALAGERCNLDIPDPTQGWDACEGAADFIRAERFESDIAWVEKRGTGQWTFHFRQAPQSSEQVAFSVWSADGRLVLNPLPDWQLTVLLVQGALEAKVQVGVVEEQPFVAQLVDEVVAAINQGDKNRNGVFGADDVEALAGAEVWPGSLEKSYLWGRITGTVPGTRMPLANAPLTNAEYVALACWIEGFQEDAVPETEIDYEGCEYAKAPMDPAAQ